MLRTPRWFVCIWKHTFPLIYRCMGLCNEYSALQHAPPHPNSWLLRSSPSHRCSLPSAHSSQIGGPTWQGRFSPGIQPGALVAMYSLQVLMLFPNSLALLFVNDRDPPFASPPLNQLISAGFGTKSHLGETTCQLRSVFKTSSPQHLSAGIKDIPVESFKHSQYCTSLPITLFFSFSANKTSIQ